MLFRIGDNVAVTCKNPNETLLFINRVPTAWLFSIDIEICQNVKRMIVEEQNLKDIKQEKRHFLDPHISNLINSLRELESDDEKNSMSGNLNYVITKLLVEIS